MARFTKKPITVDAVQWRGNNLPSVKKFTGEEHRLVTYGASLKLWAGGTVHTVEQNDWIVRGVEGEIYPCPASVFAKTYERA